MTQYRSVLIVAVAGMIGLSGCQTRPATFTAPDRVNSVSLTKDPRSRALYRSLIAQLNQDGKYYAALAHISEFERLYGKTPQTTMLRGDAFVGLGALTKAEAAYASIPDGSLSGDKQFGLGRVAAAHGDWKRASSYLRNAVAQQPTNVRFLNDFGCALYRLGRRSAALFALHKAHELAPADAEVRRNLAIVSAAGRKPGEAGNGDHAALPASRSPAASADIASVAITGRAAVP